MDSDRSGEERSRAYARNTTILSVHLAAIEAFTVLAASPDALALISASGRLRLGVNPKFETSDGDDYAERTLVVLRQEHDRGYEFIRTSALIAVCGAFEYLVKATFVDQAEANPVEAAAKLSKARIRIAAADVLGVLPSEQWFGIADRLFEQLAEPHPRMHERLRKFWLDYTYFQYDVDANFVKTTLDSVDAQALNETFLVRNCMVHKGGRVSSQLAHLAKKQIGESVELDKKCFHRLLRPIRSLAEMLGNPPLQAI